MMKNIQLQARTATSEGISEAEFSSLATHMTHSEATAKKYYAVTRPTDNSLLASKIISRNRMCNIVQEER